MFKPMDTDNKNIKSSVFVKITESSQKASETKIKPILIEKKATKTSRGILSKGWYKIGSATAINS
jgi:hypothetical protein